ncbi:MAG: polyphosphate kinase 1 [Myxococcota bacterium]
MMYLDRDLSQLSFHSRVLELAEDINIPILERLKFLCISSSNLDEFFEIRVASLKQKALAGLGNHELLAQISREAHQLVEKQYHILNNVLRPLLTQEGIQLNRRSEWTTRHEQWTSEYFTQELLPILSPIGLDPAHPFPKIPNKSLNFIVALEGKDAFGREIGMAVVPAPRALPRLIRVPAAYTEMEYEFISLAAIIRAHVHILFPDMQVTQSYQFRVTRNSNLFVDEEEVEDLLTSLEGELPSRRYGDAVRLEIESDCPERLVEFLRHHFLLTPEDVYCVNGPVNLSRLSILEELVDRPALKYPTLTPNHQTISFASLQKSDLLMLHPFESFAAIADLLKQASQDPDVLVIKQTLYRTGADSVIVDYLLDAARLGKEVMVVIELRARFDEEANISLAARLQQAGVHVVYGVVGYKTHAKMLLIVRREATGLTRYVHLGTGNYHSKTTRQYTDYSFLTCDAAFGDDVHQIFMELTGLSKVGELQKCLDAPFLLRKAFKDKIEREIAHKNAGRPAHIKAKMNGLADLEMMELLEKAAQAGVQVDLIVRGMCSLKPAANLKIRSVLGRFLEHARVYYFENNGDPEVYLSSADLMTRNLSQRIEVAFPIENAELQKRVIHESIDLYWLDNSASFDLQEDGSYRRSAVIGEKISAQEKLLLELASERKES